MTRLIRMCIIRKVRSYKVMSVELTTDDMNAIDAGRVLTFLLDGKYVAIMSHHCTGAEAREALDFLRIKLELSK